METRRVTQLRRGIAILGGIALLTGCGRTGMDTADGGTEPLPTSEGPTPTPTGSQTTPVIPTRVDAQVVYTAPQRGYTSPLVRSNLPKLAADGDYWYATHAHLNAGSDNQYVAVVRKLKSAPASAPWEQVGTIARPDGEPAGLAMDAADRLHLVFQCVRDQGGILDIQIGGGGSPDRCFSSYEASSSGTSWHVVFETRSGSALLFDQSSANATETITGNRGQLGLGVSGARTWWTGLDDSGVRKVRVWDSSSTWSDVPFPSLAKSTLEVREPLVAQSPLAAGDSLILAGEWDRDVDNYIASSGFKSMQNSLAEVVRRSVSGAVPLDVATEPNGTFVALIDEDNQTSILRFDGGLGTQPVVLPIDVTPVAKLQINSAGHWYVIDFEWGTNVDLLVSSDRGATWTKQSVPISGLPGNGDSAYGEFAPLEPHSAAVAYDPDRLVFLFTGANVDGYRATYLGTMDLK